MDINGILARKCENTLLLLLCIHELSNCFSYSGIFYNSLGILKMYSGDVANNNNLLAFLRDTFWLL